MQLQSSQQLKDKEAELIEAHATVEQMVELQREAHQGVASQQTLLDSTAKSVQELTADLTEKETQLAEAHSSRVFLGI